MGTGMEEIYQITSALKFLKFGKQVAVITDARFSGVSTGACIGHVGPEALAGGPIGKVRDGDLTLVFSATDPQVRAVLHIATYDQHGHYLIVIGVLFMIAVIAFPRGLVGHFAARRGHRRGRP